MPRCKLGLLEQLGERELGLLRVGAVVRVIDLADVGPVVDALAVPGHEVRHRVAVQVRQSEVDDELTLALLQQVELNASLLSVLAADWYQGQAVDTERVGEVRNRRVALRRHRRYHRRVHLFLRLGGQQCGHRIKQARSGVGATGYRLGLVENQPRSALLLLGRGWIDALVL